MPASSLREVIERHRESLLAFAGVAGVAAGRDAAGGPCVVVFGAREQPPPGLPASLEGYPVEYRRTGQFRAR
jgi:hypothetical protein